MMNKNIEHYIYHKENFLDEKKCDDFINELDESAWKKHEWYHHRTDSYGQLGEKEIYFKSEDREPENCIYSDKIEEINYFIIDNLHSTILEYIERLKFSWFDGWEAYSKIKFLRYFPGQTMQKHCDHIHDLFDGERKGIPILTILGFLNDDYEGGELILQTDKKINTNKGDIVMFPSNFLYPHEITPVTKGVRYSYTSWVW